MENKKICAACHTEMKLESKAMKMGSAFLMKRVCVDIYRCPECDRVELFAAEPEENVTCPVCGTTHGPDEQCAVCALTRMTDQATHLAGEK